MKKIKIGIIGLGYVGGAVKHWFENQPRKYNLFFYDKYKNIGSPKEVNQADIIFAAVPTPFYEKDGGYDDSEIKTALKNIKNGKIVVIKSTIPPGSTDNFQRRYPGKTLLFNPEFLTAKNAIKNFLNPSRQIIGYTNKKSKRIAKKILKILPESPYEKIIKAREAEMIKYFANTFLACQVIFANQIYDLCQKLGGIDYDIIKEAVVQDKRIGNAHFNVFTGGYRGYEGPCFLKDTKTFLQLAKKHRINLELIKKIDEINERLLKNNKSRTFQQGIRPRGPKLGGEGQAGKVRDKQKIKRKK